MNRQTDLTVKRGCTLQSGKFFSVNEVVPKNITYAQLLAGIANSTYTKKSLENKTYKGQVRNLTNGVLAGDLVFEVVDDEMSFSLPASVTVTWPNVKGTFFYDVFETDTITNVVRLITEGKVNVIPAMTKEDV